MNSAPILVAYLRRKAEIYIRQSTGHQVLTNRECERMQRDMKDHALRLGWPASLIEVVDPDTGNSAKTTAGRAGYKSLLSELALGEVGIVLSYESTRLTRNCSDWYPLLDLCSLHHCLSRDRDGVYDPSTSNGRLLLGMKGIFSERLRLIHPHYAARVARRLHEAAPASLLDHVRARAPAEQLSRHACQLVEPRSGSRFW